MIYPKEGRLRMTDLQHNDYFGDIDFWMLNGRLSKDEIVRQMKQLKAQNIRCFIARTYIGLESDYPGTEFKTMLRHIVETAAKLDMNLFLQAAYMPDGIPTDRGFHCGEYLTWNNGQITVEKTPTHLDVFSPEAVRKYLDYAYGTVWQEFAPYFGNVIKSIWVDEPSYPRMKVPWSSYLAEAFEKQWNYDPVEHLSKLFTDEDGAETFRCQFYATVTRQLEKAYLKPLKKWCNDHGLLASGHLLMEDSMYYTLSCGGAMMPFYKYFDIPGMDVLTGENKFIRYPLNRKFSSPDIHGMQYLTPLQCVSAANQAGKKHILCEMYGVTTENFGLREQKNMFDYFALFGITRRSVHGMFYSLRGRRKRAYPPHVFDYQPYWNEYNMLTAETLETSEFVARGEPVRDILVIHPLWTAAALYNYSCGYERLKNLDWKFLDLLVNMMHRHYRFDLGDEESIADCGVVKDDAFVVGKMSYKAVVLPYMLVISRPVLTLLHEFIAQGGKVFVLGSLPSLLNGVPAADEIAVLLSGSEVIADSNFLPDFAYDRKFTADDPSALLISQRQDGKEKLFFIFNSDHQNSHEFELKVDDMELFEQRNNRLYPLPGGIGIIPEGGSMRVIARPGQCMTKNTQKRCCRMLELPGKWRFEGRSNDNTLLLEFARFRCINTESWSPLYPILAIQQILTEQNYHGIVELKYEILCSDAFENTYLAVEEADAFTIQLNGEKVSNKVIGFHLARDFQKIALPVLLPGRNELVVSRDFSPLTKPTNGLASLYEKLIGCELENCYITGNFAVQNHTEFTLTNCIRINPASVLTGEAVEVNGNLTENGYPFYAGKVRLSKEFVLPEDVSSKALLKLPCPDAAVVVVELNGKRQGVLGWYPYELVLDGLKPGRNVITLELSSTLRNFIGPFHRPQGEYGYCFDGYACPNLNWVGIREADGTPIENWYDHRDVDSSGWCESYLQVRFGITGTPVIQFQ